jgi:hypothetical protein
MPYIIQNFFILVAPALFAASIYMTLGRIIRAVKGENHSLIRVSRLTKTFVIGDVLSFWVQGGSAGLMFQSSTVKYGQAMVVGGLFIQIIMFGLFVCTAVIFQVRLWSFHLIREGCRLTSNTFQARLSRSPTPESYNVDIPWKKSLNMLYAVSGLIMVRSIFRVVEYLMGADGYSLTHEWTLFCFDSLLMFLVTVIFFIRYPSELQRHGDDESVQMIPQAFTQKWLSEQYINFGSGGW